MRHGSLNGEIYQLIGAARDFGVQVWRIEKIHRDALFWVNPLTNELVFFFVGHVATHFRVIEEANQDGYPKGRLRVPCRFVNAVQPTALRPQEFETYQGGEFLYDIAMIAIIWHAKGDSPQIENRPLATLKPAIAIA